VSPIPAAIILPMKRKSTSQSVSMEAEGNPQSQPAAKQARRTRKSKAKPILKTKTHDDDHDVDQEDSYIFIQGDADAFSALDKTVFNKLQSRVDNMSTEMQQQRKIIQELTARLAFVTSLLDIDVDVNDHVDDQSGVSAADALNSFATVVKRPTIVAANRAVQESVVAAMYVDNQRRLNRATNIIVSGLAPSTQSDQQLVTDLGLREFKEKLDVVHVKRLGKPITGRVQPLLVVLKTVAQAKTMLQQAKNLRQSADSIIKQSVFISANLTKAEARAAYELRCQRRQAVDRRGQQRQQQQQPQQKSQQSCCAQNSPVAGAGTSAVQHNAHVQRLPPYGTLQHQQLQQQQQ